MTLNSAVKWLIRQHGGLRAAARNTGIHVSYLISLRDGKQTNPSPELIARMGLEMRVDYRRKKT